MQKAWTEVSWQIARGRDNPACADSDEKLYECYEGALELAKTLFAELEVALAGQGDLGPGFDHTFGET